MKVKELIAKLLEMNPELDVYVSDGEDALDYTYAEAELVDTARQVAYKSTNPDVPFYVEPVVIEVVRIRRYRW